MAQNLYLTAIEPGSGKSLVVLGLAELLSKHGGRFGLFRPVIHVNPGPDPAPDNDIELIRTRYRPDLPYEMHYALTHLEAQALVADGRHDELLTRIIEQYKALEAQCDFVLCEGTNLADLIFEFDFNGKVANHLAAPLAIVACGRDRGPEEIVSVVRAERETFVEEGCTIAATFVNRVAAADRAAVVERLQAAWPYEDPVFVLPEHDLLSRPTVAEIARALDARLLFGDRERLNRATYGFKVAAMQVPHVLNRMEAGNLVVTPGDRADILLACLATALSERAPDLAGVLLTGGMEPEPPVRNLIEGCQQWTVPILGVATDTYETATRVAAVRAAISPDTPRKIATALGIFEDAVDLPELERRIDWVKPTRVTPLAFEYGLIQQAKAARKHIVLPEGSDDRILQAAEILLRRRVADLTLLGSEADIRNRAAALGVDLSDAAIVDPAESEWHENFAMTYFDLRRHKGISEGFARDLLHDVSYFGTMMVYKGLADGMVSGAVHTTAHTIRPALEFVKTKPGTSIVSSVFLMCLPDRVLVYGDCAVNPNPNPQQLADIAISSAETAATFGIEPRVALLSYSTGQSGKGEAVDKVREATRLARELRPDLQIEGPIQYDAAIDEEVAKTKLPGSLVAGHATVFVFPDLNTGNNTYKAVQRAAKAVAIGPVLQGLKKPVNDLSRGCTVPDIANTVAITAIQAAADADAAEAADREAVLAGS